MVKVKICGITNLEDALVAVEYGTDMIGFIFASGPRKVTPEVVSQIVDQLPKSIVKVGVFMDHPLYEVAKIIVACRLDIAQLHGGESPEFCAALACEVIKTFTPQTLPDFTELENYPVDYFMLDKQKGDKSIRPEELWPIAGEMREYGKVILAGALTPDNVSEAIKVAKPYVVDVASGVEREPGKKDHNKVREFIRRARS